MHFLWKMRLTLLLGWMKQRLTKNIILIKSIAAMLVQGDVEKHQEIRFAKEHAKHAVRDATVCHLALMGTRPSALAMPPSRLMETSPSALKKIIFID
ncbi:hypothetical protein LguiA_004808 [Lonicera macranthoides]